MLSRLFQKVDALQQEAMQTNPPGYRPLCYAAMLGALVSTGRLSAAREAERWVQKRWQIVYGVVPCIGDLYPGFAREVLDG
jgi:hypothetical protein